MKLTIRKEQRKAQFYPEDLGNGTVLDMVLIPGGSFQMGSPEEDLERDVDEGPQRPVIVPTFFMGKYVVTQAQWRAVAAFPKIERDLEPDPSNFKGANRPVEQVSWHEANEFCHRLVRHTGRPYRLPSEAEWEYACRAQTKTPFYFGETITTDLANYCGEDRTIDEEFYSGSYGRGIKGSYRQQTTSVGSFPANAFGLYDMHGNVWEWCADHWHDSYESAPEDGSAWLDSNADEDAHRVLRGGSWNDLPRLCRSAIRYYYDAGIRDDNFGFRVVAGERIPSRSGAAINLNPEVWHQLENACRTQKTVQMTYYTASRDSVSERKLDPYVLHIYRGTNPYVIGFCHQRQEIRWFRVDRIRAIAVLGESFVPDPTFDAKDHLEMIFQHGPRGVSQAK